MNGISIKLKLVLGFTLIAIIAIIYGVFTYTNLSSSRDSIKLQGDKYEQLLISKNIHALYNKIQVTIYNSIEDRDIGDLSEENLKAFQDSFNKFNKESKNLLSYIDTEDKKKRVTHIIEQFNMLNPLLTKKLPQLIQNEASYEQFDELDQEIEIIESTLITDIEGLNKIVLDELVASEKSIEESINSSLSVTIIITICIVALLVAISIAILNALKGVLQKSFGHISQSSYEILNASSQISNSANSLSEQSSSQAAMVEEVNANIEEAYTSISQNRTNAQQANELSQDANNSALKGYENIKELSNSMQNINESSTKISNIIKTIDEIAFQTNLLALNAAVEAARAGEHGLGFAVVAEEVRSLAGRSAEAAQETEVIIDESVQQVHKGNDITKLTNTSFDDILSKSKSTNSIIQDITESSDRQHESIQLISRSLDTVDSNTQSMASSSEELAATAEELNSQAQSMTESINTITKSIGFDFH
jgi:methyl-accepting chemotaxis protein